MQTAGRASWSARLGDDLITVGGFLDGKLVSHSVLGALLDGLGLFHRLTQQTTNP